MQERKNGLINTGYSEECVYRNAINLVNPSFIEYYANSNRLCPVVPCELDQFSHRIPGGDDIIDDHARFALNRREIPAHRQ